MTNRMGAAAAIDDARAMLATFLESGWRDLHVRTPTIEIFITANRGRRDPLSGRLVTAEHEALPPGETWTVAAPHVATVVDVVPVGTHVEAGGQVAVLRVLNDEQPLCVDRPGTILTHEAMLGALVDYAAAIVVMEAIA